MTKRLYNISVKAGNFGIPGMLGKFRSVKESAAITNRETALYLPNLPFCPAK